MKTLCIAPETCPIAHDAQREAHAAKAAALEAVENSGAAIGQLATLHQQVDAQGDILRRIDRRTRWQTILQWAVPVLVTAVGIYVGWAGATQQTRNDRAGYDGGQRAAVDELRRQSETTEQIAIRAGRAAAKQFAEEFTLRANPAPIASASAKR